MVQVYVQYDSCHIKTVIKVNGINLEDNHPILNEVRGKRFSKWIAAFPQLLKEMLNEKDFEIEFCGSQLYWDDFENAFIRAKNKGIIRELALNYVKRVEKNKDSEETAAFLRNFSNESCLNCFDKDLRQLMEDMNHLEFSVFFISDTGSGKSTLMNALLGKKLLFSKKGGGSAAVTEIVNNNNRCFHALAYRENGVVSKEIDNPTYDMMMELNGSEHVHKIKVEGNISFWNEKGIALTLTDTPNTKNIKRQDYNKIIDRAVSGDVNHLIVYVLDDIVTCGNMPVLKHLADKMKKGGRRVCNQVLFVINKMDMFNPEEDNIQEVILSAKNYLLSCGIENPQIIPCSAFLALGIRDYFKHKEVKDLNRVQEKRLRWVARDTLHLLDKMTGYKDMHLEQYAMLQTDTQKQLGKKLYEAKKGKDIKTQGLIYSGICSVEAAIAEHVNYYKQRKQYELAEAFDDYYRAFIDQSPCTILVTATMSAGKSTFINALTGRDICLSQNMACTDKIQPIISKLLDTEVRLKYDNDLVAGIDKSLKKEIQTVYFDGALGGQRLVVYDSPGVNYSGDSEHKKITDKMIRMGNYQLMVYLMNATQLGTNDEEEHLEYVKKWADKKTVLFAVNKVDAFNEDDEEIEEIVSKQAAYLKSKGFANPMVCPVSAKAGFLAKKSLREPLSKLERRELNCLEDKFAQMKIVDYYHKHFPNIKIGDSENDDIQLLKTCGIIYVESIIKILNRGGSVNGTSIR